ncbi:taste receptor type 2 member 1 [Meriones unguiculatus]|uniref:taste receptor type 2 member 1 n=1 Tax=Meriones unguiculatus TaxID=10047 RepID=UPI000B4F6A68|nr:taste receptor type 2 member 1 [Meriones unguiculatus]
MLEGVMLFFFLAVMVQFFTGVLASGLIVVFSAIDLITHRKMAPLDLLLSCLATSRIILQMCVFLAQLSLLYLVKYSLFVDNITFVLFTNELNLWLATWLGVFYCAKIATIPHPLFLWLKMRISRLVPWLILGSVFYSTITAIIHSRETATISKQTFTSFFSKNATHSGQINATLLSVFILGLTLPLLIFIVAVLLLISSLCKHSWQMKTMVGARKSSRYSIISAMLSIILFLFLYFSHYMIVVLISTQGFQFGRASFQVGMLVFGICLSLHSIVLILGNPKLKQNAKMFIVHCKCCHCEKAWIISRAVPVTHHSATKT